MVLASTFGQAQSMERTSWWKEQLKQTALKFSPWLAKFSMNQTFESHKKTTFIGSNTEYFPNRDGFKKLLDIF